MLQIIGTSILATGLIAGIWLVLDVIAIDLIKLKLHRTRFDQVNIPFAIGVGFASIYLTTLWNV